MSSTKLLSIYFVESSLFYVLLPVLDWFETWCYHCSLLSRGRYHPPRYCDFPEELVVDGERKTLGLHLLATYRNVVLLIFDSVCFRPSYYYVYRQSQPFERMS